jgi:transcriptional regulator
MKLIREFPLVWVISADRATPVSTMLPVIPVSGSEGALETLVGHFARHNRHVPVLKENPRVLILAQGPSGYISPSWLRDKTRAPTWNYAWAQFIADIEFFDEPEQIAAHLRELVEANEAGRPNAWNVDMMGARFESLAKGVIGFRAQVAQTSVRLKMGQDERDSEFHDITAALEAAGGGPLLDWMRAANAHR